MRTLRTQVEKTAKDINATEIEVITAMQAECAKRGDEKSLEVLAELKYTYIKF